LLLTRWKGDGIRKGYRRKLPISLQTSYAAVNASCQNGSTGIDPKSFAPSTAHLKTARTSSARPAPLTAKPKKEAGCTHRVARARSWCEDGSRAYTSPLRTMQHVRLLLGWPSSAQDIARRRMLPWSFLLMSSSKRQSKCHGPVFRYATGCRPSPARRTSIHRSLDVQARYAARWEVSYTPQYCLVCWTSSCEATGHKRPAGRVSP
jgi:hypothetical protein